METEHSGRENDPVLETKKIFTREEIEDFQKLLKSKGELLRDKLTNLARYSGEAKEKDNDVLIFTLLNDIKSIEKDINELADKIAEIRDGLKKFEKK